MRRMMIPVFALVLLGACDTNTKTVDACGDGFLDPGEACDGGQMTATTCVELGYYEQTDTLTCRSDCTFDLSVCMGGKCGDGTIQAIHGETCDGENLAGATCANQGQGGGVVSCNEYCRLDISRCELSAECGDGVAAIPYEPCDGTDLGGQSCLTQGFGSGTLACGETCGFETGGCSMNYESANIGTLIHVPAGTFQRDATATNLSTVSAFRMSRYEITRAQWVAVTGWADPSNATYSSGASDPVQMVSWYDAIAFCNKLSLQEGLTSVYTVSGVDFSTLTYDEIPTSSNTSWNAATANWAANGYRLPTEMEWMWAAMGADLENPGVMNTTGYTKAFAGSTGSNVIGDYAVFGYSGSETGRTTTQRSNPVGSKLENELGFHDLSGNVWEWSWDWHATPYPTGTLTDYRGPASGDSRVERGGYWHTNATGCTVAHRISNEPYGRYYSIGFRVVRP
jgi:formylglycine-generating enzyme required for sulfatase activity